MLPTYTKDNFTNSNSMHAKHGGKLLLRKIASGIQAANSHDLFICQMSFITLFTAWMASLCNLIVHVVLMFSQEQVIGIDTRRIIARMTNDQSFWNRPVMLFPGKTMSIHHGSTVNSYLTVPVFHTVSMPKPAGISLLNVRPEALYQHARTMSMIAVLTTKNATLIVGKEVLMAILAYGEQCVTMVLHAKLILSCAAYRAICSSADTFLFLPLYHMLSYEVTKRVVARRASLQGGV